MKNTSWQQRNIPILFIVSNNPDVRELWVSVFEKDYDVTAMKTVDIPLNLAKQWPDIVLMDNASDEANDINVCTGLRRDLSIPILVLVEYCHENHLLELYKAGANDCILKPVGPLIVRAKLRAWTRYTHSSYMKDQDVIEVMNWRLLSNTRELFCDSDHPIHLTILEHHLMYILMSRANKTVFTDFLVDHLWKKSGSGDAIQLKNLIYRLRKKIEPAPETPTYLLTIAGIGYSLRLIPKK